eukprot:2964549-Pyramimonas_sp.AAC.1
MHLTSPHQQFLTSCFSRPHAAALINCVRPAPATSNASALRGATISNDGYDRDMRPHVAISSVTMVAN